MPRQVFGFRPDDLPQPAADLRAVYVVVVNPTLIPRVVRRVDVDALHLAGVVRQERLERDQIVPLNQQVPAAGVADRKRLVALEQVVRNLPMMVHHGLLSNPIECRHVVVKTKA